MTYVNFSNDGKKFYNGEEEFIGEREGKNAKNVYRSIVVLSGSEKGTNSLFYPIPGVSVQFAFPVFPLRSLFRFQTSVHKPGNNVSRLHTIPDDVPYGIDERHFHAELFTKSDRGR